MKGRTAVTGVLVALGLFLGGYGSWLLSQPKAVLSEISRASGLVLTTGETSVGLPYRLKYEDLTVRAGGVQGNSADALSLSFGRLVLTALGLHSARVAFSDLTVRSQNPLTNMLLSAVGVRKGSVVVRETPGKILLPSIEASDTSLTILGKGEIDRIPSGEISRFEFTFDLEARGPLAEFLGTGRQSGRLWGGEGESHLVFGGRQVF